jgi:hypothetical protein
MLRNPTMTASRSHMLVTITQNARRGFPHPVCGGCDDARGRLGRSEGIGKPGRGVRSPSVESSTSLRLASALSENLAHGYCTRRRRAWTKIGHRSSNVPPHHRRSFSSPDDDRVRATLRRRYGDLTKIARADSPRPKVAFDVGLSLHALGHVCEFVRRDLRSGAMQGQPTTLRVLLAHEARTDSAPRV